MKRLMCRSGVHNGCEVYSSKDGWTMKREEGLTPNGNPIGSRWVLRNAKGGWVDVDKYCIDLTERHGFAISAS